MSLEDRLNESTSVSPHNSLVSRTGAKFTTQQDGNQQHSLDNLARYSRTHSISKSILATYLGTYYIYPLLAPALILTVLLLLLCL
jgi:hypothetical protein